MSKNELEKIWDLPSELPYRERVEELQCALKELVGDKGDFKDDCKSVVYPSATRYNHYFSGGLYIREMFCEKGYFCFTVIHKTANPLFLLKGKVAFSSDEGVETLTAPTFILTKPGAKRICYWLEDSIIVTVHPNPSGLTDLNEIEKEMFACDWEEYDKDPKEDTWELKEHEEYQNKIIKE